MKHLFKILFFIVIMVAVNSLHAQEYAKIRHKKGKADTKKEVVQKEGQIQQTVKKPEPKTEKAQPALPEDNEFIRLMNAAAKHVSRKEYLNALGLYNKAMVFNRETARVLRCRGAAYFGAKDYLNAVKDYTDAINLKTDYPGEVYYSRGVSKVKMAEPDREGACADFKKAKELGFDIDTDKMIEKYCD